MVSCWKLVQALSTKARASPGLHRTPHSLETSLFYAHRFLIVHLIHSASAKRLSSKDTGPDASFASYLSSSRSYPTSQATDRFNAIEVNTISPAAVSQQYQLEQHVYYCVLRDILAIFFHLPHMEQLMKHHFSETENILRLVASSCFNNISDADALPFVHRLAGMVLECHRDQLTTANLILIATLLHRDNDHYASGGIRRKDNILTSGSQHSLNRAEEEISQQQQQQQQEHESVSVEGRKGVSNPEKRVKAKEIRTKEKHHYLETEEDRASIIAREHWRERLLQEVFHMCSSRLRQNIENGFPDDSLTTLCQKHTETRGFHILQGESLQGSMTYAEFTFFFTLLTERIKRKQLLSASSGEDAQNSSEDPSDHLSMLGSTSGRHAYDPLLRDTTVEKIPGIPHTLVKRVSLALERLCLFQDMKKIARHRSIHADELKFILEVALSPVPTWSQHGLVAFRKFVAAHRAHPERGTHPFDVLSTMSEEDQCYLRATCLRRLTNAPLAQLAECFMHLLPLFMYPVVRKEEREKAEGDVECMTVKDISWMPSPGLRYMSTMQKKRFFSVARSSLYLFRMRPATIHVVRKMYEKKGFQKEGVVFSAPGASQQPKSDDCNATTVMHDANTSPRNEYFFPGTRFPNDDEVLMCAITSLAEHFVAHASEEHPFPISSGAYPYPAPLVPRAGITVLVEPSSPPTRLPPGHDSDFVPPQKLAATAAITGRAEEVVCMSSSLSSSSTSLHTNTSPPMVEEAEHKVQKEKRIELHKTMLTQERVRSYFSACEHCLHRHKSSPWLVGGSPDGSVPPALPPFTSETEQAYFDGFVRYLLSEKEQEQLVGRSSSLSREGLSQRFVVLPSLLCITAVYGLMDILPSVFTFLRGLHRPAANGERTNIALGSTGHDGKPWDRFQGRFQPTPHLAQQLEVALLRTIQLILLDSFNSERSSSATIRADHLQQVLRYMVQTLTLNYMFWQARSHRRAATARNKSELGKGELGEITENETLEIEDENSSATSQAGFLSDSMVPFLSKEEGGGAERKNDDQQKYLMEIPLAAAELASACLNLYLRERDDTTSCAPIVSQSKPVLKASPPVLVSMAILSVVLLNGLALPPSHQALKDKASDKRLLLRLFSEFGVESFSIPHVFELLALVFTHREKPCDEHEKKPEAMHNRNNNSSQSVLRPLSSSGGVRQAPLHASLPSPSEEDGCLAAIDLEDTALLEAGLRAARRVAHHHRCYEPLTLQERIRVVEHCTRIYLSIQHRFYVLDLAQKAGIVCLSACAYISLEHQFASIMEGGRGGDYERRRMQYLSQSLWHFYTMAMARPVHSGPQVEKYLRIILRFLRHHVAMVPHRKGTSTEDSFDLCLIEGTKNGKACWTQARRGEAGGGRHRPCPVAGTTLMSDYNHYVEGGAEGEAAWVQVRWKNLQRVQKINAVFSEFIAKLALQSSSRFAERTGIQPFSNNQNVHSPTISVEEQGTDGTMEGATTKTATSSGSPHTQESSPNEKQFFLLNDVEASILSSLTPEEKAILYRNVALRRALRQPIHAFQVAIAHAQKDNLPIRRAVTLSELYVILVHKHAHELLPMLWKEVCSQMMFFRQMYLRADSPGVCVLDTKKGKEVQQMMVQLSTQYLQYETFANTSKDSVLSSPRTNAATLPYRPSPGPPVSFSGIFLDLSSLSFLYSSTMASVKNDVFLLGNGGKYYSRNVRRKSSEGEETTMKRKNIESVAPKSGLLNPEDLEHLSTVLEKEVEAGASTAWKYMSERQYASSVNMLHRGLRDLFS